MNIKTRLCETSEVLLCVHFHAYRFKIVILSLIPYFTECICNLITHCFSVTLRKQLPYFYFSYGIPCILLLPRTAHNLNAVLSLLVITMTSPELPSRDVKVPGRATAGNTEK